MKFVALVSGGKDSIYATLQAIRNGHELICCAHLAPPAPRKNNETHNTLEEEEESYMYQTAGSEAVRMQVEECMGVPLYIREIHGRSCNTSLVYDNIHIHEQDGSSSTNTQQPASSDEVEDLHCLLQQIIQSHHPEIQAVSSGAILSTYQRTRIEHVCHRLQLTSLSYLWRMSCQRSILDSILDDGGIDARLVRVACPPGLLPRKHLGKSLRALRDDGTLDALQNKWGMHPAGEGGEYETLVVDCPALFPLGRLVLEEVEVVVDGSDEGVGVLRIVKCRVEKKKEKVSVDDLETKLDGMKMGGGGSLNTQQQQQRQQHQHQVMEQVQNAKSLFPVLQPDTATLSIPSNTMTRRAVQSMHLPNVRILRGGLCHISALLSPIACNNSNTNEAEAAVQEFLSIIQMMQTILSRLFPSQNNRHSSSSTTTTTTTTTTTATAQDVLFVHLYLSQISHFSKINQHYQKFFGIHLPPSRSCVAVGPNALPGGRRVMMDCILQCGSGDYLRHDGSTAMTTCTKNDNVSEDFLQRALLNHHHSLRKTLHVQSISHWAPVCIGPYSQANVLRSSLVFLAGMIGLMPESMTLIEAVSSGDTPISNSGIGGMNDWEVQLYQSWKNAASVLDGLDDGGNVMGGKLEDCLGGLVYFSLSALESLLPAKQDDDGCVESNTSIPWQTLWSTAHSISQHSLSTNGGIVMGSVDGIATETASSSDVDPSLYDEEGVLYGGYEDEETWREMSKTDSSSLPPAAEIDNAHCSTVPLLMVCLAELPMNAKSEVELVCASRRAASCLDVCTGPLVCSSVQMDSNTSDQATMPLDWGMLWDTGYDHVPPPIPNISTVPSIEITSINRSVGDGCASVSTVMASWKLGNESQHNDVSQDGNLFNFDVEDILDKMIDSAINNTSGVSGRSPSLFTVQNVLNVRLYYKAASVTRGASQDIDVEMINDGSMLRAQLHAALRAKTRQHCNKAAAGIDNETYGKAGTMNIPAYTVVPVLAMNLTNPIDDICKHECNGTPLLAMQVTLVDMIRMETELWVRYGRKYST